ncbi:unnamed protein product [Brachionus calyciflorus]|uniref:RING-type domain-containing protein n=1 Tax=Brachionus calyciflorus TaxID=104777 RepID=A0A814ECU3_9BILA|nr:unnamed protein product [Brachionus calyciflorus]
MILSDDSILCPECHKIFTDPIMLPCGETICSKCTPKVYTDKIFCSFCHTIHKIPENGFPNNKNLLKTLNSIVNDDKIQELRLLKKKIEVDFEEVKTKLENSDAKISDYCQHVINKIDLAAELNIYEINKIRNEMIKQVLEYQSTCLAKIERYKDKFDIFYTENEKSKNSFESPDPKLFDHDNYLNELKRLELIRSNIFFEKSRLDNYIFDEKEIKYESKLTSIDPDILGRISLKYKKHIKCSNLIKKPLLNLEDNKNEKSNLNVEKLNDQKLVISYNYTEFRTFFIEIHDLNDKEKNQQIHFHYEYGYFKSVIKVFNSLIYVFTNQPYQFQIFDSDLNEIESTLLPNSIDCFLITDIYVLMYGSSPSKGGVLNVYDKNLNYLLSVKNNDLNSFVYIPETISEMYANENFYFFRDTEKISIVSRRNGKLIKAMKLFNFYQIIKITNENLLIVFDTIDKNICFMDFDLKVKAKKFVIGFDEKLKVFVNDDLNKFQVLDMNNIHFYS